MSGALVASRLRNSLVAFASAKTEALKYLDEALKASAGDAALTKTFKSYRDKVSGGTVAPKSTADPKKGA
jgi:hypothetical protein